MRDRLRKGLVGAIRACLDWSGERGRRIVAEAQAQRGESLFEVIEKVNTAHGAIDFYCIGDLSLWRARTLLIKEPETIAWIDGFDANDVFWDVGANVGIYSIYAAFARTISVLAFEPAASNYLLLNRNIEINQMSDRIQAFCVALSDEDGLDMLNMTSTEFAGAMSSFADATGLDGATFTPRFRQGSIGYSIDSLIATFDPPFPNHLKIDVDSIEDKIIKGARRTLRDARLKSISIELDDGLVARTAAIVAEIEDAGLGLASRSHAAMFDGGPFAHIYNYQFRRPASASPDE